MAYHDAPMCASERSAAVRSVYLDPAMGHTFQVLNGPPTVLGYKDRKVSPTAVGTAVDYLTRFVSAVSQGAPEKPAKIAAFAPCIQGAANVKRNLKWTYREFGGMDPVTRVKSDLMAITPRLTNAGIDAALSLSFFDRATHAFDRRGLGRYDEVTEGASALERSDVRDMVRGAEHMVALHGGMDMFEIPCFSDTATATRGGVADYVTRDGVLWDMKCSTFSEVDPAWCLQVAIYYLVALEGDLLPNVRAIGVFNPNRGTEWVMGPEDLRRERRALSRICRTVVGWDAERTDRILDKI